MSSAVARLLPDGRRLHLQHGPIDLVVEAVRLDLPRNPSAPHAEVAAEGRPRSTGDRCASFEAARRAAPQDDDRRWKGAMGSGVAAAYLSATARFSSILDELCAELPELRRPARPDRTGLSGDIARRMWEAVRPFAAETFITPMAAVAGAVAEDVLAAMVMAAPLARALVNNGGDIALHLAGRERVRIGLVDRPDRPSLFGRTEIVAGDCIRGIATSGWRGRSFSLGIADAVTVLARTAAEADAAATVLANAVDLPGHPAVLRVPAHNVQADSDLGKRLVTRAVGPLAADEIAEALGRGRARAEDLASRGLIRCAALHLQGETVVAGRVKGGACFETRTSGPLLSMTHVGREEERMLQDVAA